MSQKKQEVQEAKMQIIADLFNKDSDLILKLWIKQQATASNSKQLAQRFNF